MEIKHLKNNQINFVRWDNCINTAFNGNIFAYSWYLNSICNDWEALVMGDYKYIMPLLTKKIFHKEIVFSSVLCKYLGVFTNELLTEDILIKFLEAIPPEKKWVQINLNKFNYFRNEKYKTLTTHEIDIILPYSKISERYSNIFQKDLQYSKKNKISVLQGLSPNDLIKFITAKKTFSYPSLQKKDINQLRMLMAYGMRYNLSEVYAAYTAENNLCALALFMLSKNKIYVVLSAANPWGLKTNAFYAIIDKFIQKHCEKNVTLNIENLIVKNKPDFFTGLGAYTLKYQQYAVSNVNWFWNIILKRK